MPIYTYDCHTYLTSMSPNRALKETPDFETSNNEDVGGVTKNTLILKHLIMRIFFFFSDITIKFLMWHFKA